MDSGYGDWPSEFFLPIGSVGALESDIFFLSELQNVGYDSVMALPWGRRQRFVEQERKLQERQKNAASQRGSRRRRYR